MDLFILKFIRSDKPYNQWCLVNNSEVLYLYLWATHEFTAEYPYIIYKLKLMILYTFEKYVSEVSSINLFQATTYTIVYCDCQVLQDRVGDGF